MSAIDWFFSIFILLPVSMQSERLDKILEMLKTSPEDTFLLYAAAMEYEGSGKTGEALQFFKEVLRIDPSYLSAYYRLGYLLQEAHPSEAKAWLESGIALAREKKDAKTEREMRQLLEEVEENI